MSEVKVKICGLRRTCDIDYVNELLPDYIGFLLWEKSKRAVTAAQAAELASLLDKRIQKVGVFVNECLEEIVKVVSAGTIDIIQLHGDEDAKFCANLREQVNVPIVKAVRVRDEESFLGLEAYPVDYFLFDTYTPGEYGGTGKRFDLRLGDEKYICKPYFVAGGLDAGNVHEVLAGTKATAVDVSGGVETDGFKDFAKIKAFIDSVRRDGK